MFLKIILNKIFGYIRINVEGFFIERFINKCKANGIFLWGKKGIPFYLNKYKKRKIFAMGLIVIFIIIIISSNFIWNVEIIGNEKIPKDELIKDLKMQGLEVGKLKKNINKNEVINNIRLTRKDISWIGININGTNAKVKIVESDEKPQLVKSDEFCNIIAEKDAIIQKIDSYSGTAMYKEGDLVKKGDILIAGWMEGKYTGIRYVHASGEIKAKTWYSVVEKVNLKETKMEKTGNKKTKYEIKLNNFQINFYKTLSKFKNYDTIYERQKLKIFSDFYLPVEITKCNNFETIKTVKNYTPEEAKIVATQKAEEKLNNQINSMENIQNKNINVNETEDYIEVEVIYEVLENIGTEEKIVY